MRGYDPICPDFPIKRLERFGCGDAASVQFSVDEALVRSIRVRPPITERDTLLRGALSILVSLEGNDHNWCGL
jgi:hypothetical protein